MGKKPEIDSKQCFTKDSDLVTRNIGDETIIVPVRSDVGNLDCIYNLNEVGATIWKLLDGKTTVSQLVEAIQEEYEVSKEEAEKDAFEFLESIQAAGLIRQSEVSEG